MSDLESLFPLSILLQETRIAIKNINMYFI